MALKLFSMWPVEKIEATIIAMEERISSGAASVADPNGGSATFLTISQARGVLEHLYARYEEKTGQKLTTKDVTTLININVRRRS